MKKKSLVSLFISLCMLVNLVTVVFADNELVTLKKIVNNTLTVKGYGKNVNIFLLNPGKTVADLNGAETAADFEATVNYCNVIAGKGNYSDSFEIMNVDEDAAYMLYVKDDTSEYSAEITLVKKLYVATDGSKNGNGSESNPFDSIETARAYIERSELNSPVEVIIGGGEYTITNTVTFGAADSGTEEHSITYKAADGEKVVFSGTTKLDVSKITTVTDSKILEKVDENVRGKLVELDLTKQGIAENIAIDETVGIGSMGKPMGLFLNGAKQNIARWPNVGYNLISSSIGGGNISEKTTEIGGATIGIVGLDSERAKKWQSAENMYIEGYLKNGWHEEWAKVGSINAEDAEMTLESYTQYGTKEGMRAAAVNLIEELDTAGEWYVDKESMKLYYYPPYELGNEDTLEIATLDKNFITVSGAKYLNIEGIEFRANADSTATSGSNSTDGNGILITAESDNINISDCKLYNIGMDGIRVYGTNVKIDGCVIYDTGFCGIYVNSGNRNTQETGNVVISNCHIAKASRDSGSNGIVGVRLDGGVGVVVENNMFNNMKNSAIRYSGNGHIIRQNEFYNCVNETSDAGAIYAGRSWSEYGTMIKNNYFHEIGAGLSYDYADAVFWDDNHSGNSFVGNIVDIKDKAANGLRVGGGRDNTAEGNIFISSRYGIRGEDRNITIPQAFVADDEDNFYNKTLYLSFKAAADIEGHPYYITDSDWRAPYLTLYPQIKINYKNIMEDKAYSVENKYLSNVFYDCNEGLGLQTNQQSKSTIDKNQVLTSDAFVDYSNGDYRIKNSVKTQYGLSNELPDENFRLSSIGIQKTYTIEDMDFDLVYPADGQSFAATKTLLKWSESGLADNYTYKIATDSAFKNIVKEGTTEYTEVNVEGLELNTKYYWKVTANNTSSRFGTEQSSESVYTFDTTGRVSVSSMSYNSASKTVDITLSNTKAKSEKVNVIVAVKNSDHRLLGVYFEEIEAKTSPTSKTITPTFKNDITSAYEIECYVWDSLDSMKNICKKRVFTY